MLLAQMNARVRPDVPWAAGVTLLYMGVGLLWLNGAGPPRKNAAQRHARLRLWPPNTSERIDAHSLTTPAIIALLGLLTVAWIAIGRLSPLPDVSTFPTTSYRWSMFIMGGLTAGVIEEVAFRGYMQTGIERFDRKNAIWISSLVFVVAHITHGIGTVIILGPGFFAAAMLYGLLARRTGTILPGIVIHMLGDLAHVYFGVLRGDASLLFAS
jgi:membrane protease YdiL (CAAX protease family)